MKGVTGKIANFMGEKAHFTPLVTIVTTVVTHVTSDVTGRNFLVPSAAATVTAVTAGVAWEPRGVIKKLKVVVDKMCDDSKN